mmetsp:Transcript_1445/g.2360  ORF Transcript_1445/g.2360 Transcript_1445/m.2360 type:complete len:219 (+) Transcript_1445:541-1197(+)
MDILTLLLWRHGTDPFKDFTCGSMGTSMICVINPIVVVVIIIIATADITITGSVFRTSHCSIGLGGSAPVFFGHRLFLCRFGFKLCFPFWFLYLGGAASAFFGHRLLSFRLRFFPLRRLLPYPAFLANFNRLCSMSDTHPSPYGLIHTFLSTTHLSRRAVSMAQSVTDGNAVTSLKSAFFALRLPRSVGAAPSSVLGVSRTSGKFAQVRQDLCAVALA